MRGERGRGEHTVGRDNAVTRDNSHLQSTVLDHFCETSILNVRLLHLFTARLAKVFECAERSR